MKANINYCNKARRKLAPAVKFFSSVIKKPRQRRKITRSLEAETAAIAARGLLRY
jgi:hypothetical protein